jgi:hypothetical protein
VPPSINNTVLVLRTSGMAELKKRKLSNLQIITKSKKYIGKIHRTDIRGCDRSEKWPNET